MFRSAVDEKAARHQQETKSELGGDGNILGAARTLSPFGVPLLGINRGRLGFLADVSPEEIELRVGEVLAGDFTIEEHFLLEGEVSIGKGKEVSSALNEIILHSASMAKMMEFDLYIDDAFVYKQHSDGLIVSSPTGSTAYALSAGGPIMHPSLDAMVLVPMFPHTLTSRPLVVPGSSDLKIVIGSTFGADAKVSFDSQLEFNMKPGESVVIRKKKEKLKKPEERSECLVVFKQRALSLLLVEASPDHLWQRRRKSWKKLLKKIIYKWTVTL